jgi:hypothetical protein
MPNKQYDRARELATSITGQRFCTHCRMNQRAEGGAWKVTNNGKSRRWKCQLCVSKNNHAAARNWAMGERGAAAALAAANSNG